MKASFGIFLAILVSSSLALQSLTEESLDDHPEFNEVETMSQKLDEEEPHVLMEALATVGLMVTIESVAFPGVYLRMDGGSVTSFSGIGAGTVNCQYGVGPYEKFVLRAYSGNQFSIESLQFPGVFLRMDGSTVTVPNGAGGGVVNAQFTAGPYERFAVRQTSEGMYCFESVQFPDVFLRMDGSSVKDFSGSGGGRVNCQKGVGPWEQFKIRVI